MENNQIGNTFKLLPLINVGDIFYIIEKEGETYYTYSYKVDSKNIVEPQQTDILRQDSYGSMSTLITCYPIGSLDQRLIITGQPILTIVSENIDQILQSLSISQQTKLRDIAKSLKAKYASQNIPPEFLVHQLQKERKLLHTRTDLSPADKNKRDNIRQFLIYQLASGY